MQLPEGRRRQRRDQLEETRHYQNRREDLELCRQVGARFVRYGPPYYRMQTGPYMVFDEGKAIMKMQQVQRWAMHNTRYGSPAHKAIAVAKPLAAGIAVALGIALAGRLGAKR